MGLIGLIKAYAKIRSLVNGKKTHIVSILIGIGAGLQLTGYEVPQAVWYILGALGLSAVRSGIAKLKK